MTWETPAGVTHRREVPLRVALPDNLNGRVVFFVVSDDRVEVRVVRMIELRAGRHPDLCPAWEWRMTSEINAGVPAFPGPSWE